MTLPFSKRFPRNVQETRESNSGFVWTQCSDSFESAAELHDLSNQGNALFDVITSDHQFIERVTFENGQFNRPRVLFIRLPALPLSRVTHWAPCDHVNWALRAGAAVLNHMLTKA